ncbi:MAG: hypothetical protein ABIF01_03930 [Candidatus Micrarchaeota archaeon]
MEPGLRRTDVIRILKKCAEEHGGDASLRHVIEEMSKTTREDFFASEESASCPWKHPVLKS